MTITPTEIKTLIEKEIPNADVHIDDLNGDGKHYAAWVVSEKFRGKSRVEQHKMVYHALKNHLDEELHAIAIQTNLPEISL